MKTELYQKYRPKTFEEVVGQNAVVRSFSKYVEKSKVPHAVLFTGPSGCGKTTLARILCRQLQCRPVDVKELNSSNFRGIDTVRSINQQLTLSPLRSPCKVWIIDECHKLTNDAQNAILKMLEDCPDHVYFFLTTTDPHKLLRAIRTRCDEAKVDPLTDDDIKQLLLRVLKQEERTQVISKNVIASIVDKCEGSARQALVMLHSVIELDDEETMLKRITNASAEVQGINLARLLFSPRPQWPEVARLLKDESLIKEEAEGIRRIILGYAKSILLSGGKMAPRAVAIVSCFRDHYYDCGFAGLVADCYDIVHSK
jgi:DNA polymerase-3 subunit gamma/tau